MKSINSYARDLSILFLLAPRGRCPSHKFHSAKDPVISNPGGKPHPYSSKIHAVEIVPQTSSFLQLLSVQHKVTVSGAEGTQRLNPQGLVYSLIVTLDRKPTFFQALRATS